MGNALNFSAPKSMFEGNFLAFLRPLDHRDAFCLLITAGYTDSCGSIKELKP